MRVSPLVRGLAWALAAAVSFGVTTPLIARTRGVAGPWTIAALLYGGAALFALVCAGSTARSLATLRRHARVYVGIAIVGGALAPAAFAAGLGFAGPLGSSLALNLETVFSIALAAIVFREAIGPRVAIAGSTIALGAIVLAARGGGSLGTQPMLGIGLVACATMLWAIDNALSSTLRTADTRATVFWKATLGAMLSGTIALFAREATPSSATIAVLALVGGVGYGASLWCYLQAQRTFGIARTASLFAIAPFVGAVVSLAFGDAHVDLATGAVFALMAIGVALHATERHAHRHRHHAIAHDHLHRHDDDHHDHAHPAGDASRGEHAHEHRHDDLEHEHDHAPDPHHAHEHVHRDRT